MEAAMRLEWLDDLLAIVDHGGLAKAAMARLLTQPAFSRRIRTIEEHIGVDLIDRASRPVRLTDATLAHEARMRELAAGLRQLGRDLSRQGDALRNSIVVASQHAITTSLAPRLIRRHLPANADYRLRSENREECYALVMTRQADIVLAYQTATDRFAAGEDLLEEQSLGSDRVIPVFAAPGMDFGDETPAIQYPTDVFLGRLMERDIRSRLPEGTTLAKRAETALTTAALHLALEGVGVAWVPRTLASRDLARGVLVDLSDRLPSATIEIAAFRLRRPEPRAVIEEEVWRKLAAVDDIAQG
jgi:LysR family transcriptional regulator, hypochlorite-specific transcription factor HypT